MVRAIWKGVLTLEAEDAIEIPVKFYSAAEDRRVRFRLLHAKDGVPVKQRLVDSSTGEEVPQGAVTKAMKVDDELVGMAPGELAEDAPEDSRVVLISRFVPAAAIDVGWFDRPYHLGPDGDDAEYLALVKALADGERLGVAHWVMRKKRYHGALGARDGRLAMVTLRPAGEVVPASTLERPEGPTVTAAERKLAEQLVSSLDAEFDPEAFHDEYSERVMKLIRAKAEGGTYTVEEPEKPRAPQNMLAALRASLGQAKMKKGKRVAG